MFNREEKEKNKVDFHFLNLYYALHRFCLISERSDLGRIKKDIWKLRNLGEKSVTFYVSNFSLNRNSSEKKAGFN